MSRQRTSRHLPQKTQIFIFSNGETEINYFNLKKKDLKGDRTIKIQPLSVKKDGVINFVKYAKETHLDKYDLNKKDKAFCVIDLDTENDEDIQKALSIMPPYMQLIVSNPDFELWFLLHYELCRGPLCNREPIELLRRHERLYEKPDVDRIYPSLKQKEAVAIQHAKSLREHHTNEGHNLYCTTANPCTNVDEAILYIYNHVNQEVGLHRS